MTEKFAGDKKFGKSFLHNMEVKLKSYLTKKVPPFLETYHLTYMTIIWCLGVVFFSFVASKNGLAWMWLVSLMIILQYITDLVDGEIGRVRNTGLIKWGYFMDHFLDYMFLCSIIIGYVFVMPKFIQDLGVINFHIFLFPIEINYYYLMFYVFMIFGGFMVVSFLSFNATNRFQIAYFGVGPTEIRILFIIFNTLLIIFPEYSLYYFTPIMLICGIIGIIVFVYRTQKELWQIDMEEKKKNIK